MEQNLTESPSIEQLEWNAPELREFDVGLVTQANADIGDDGMGIFTHS
jgi:hypothetical protein